MRHVIDDTRTKAVLREIIDLVGGSGTTKEATDAAEAIAEQFILIPRDPTHISKSTDRLVIEIARGPTARDGDMVAYAIVDNPDQPPRFMKATIFDAYFVRRAGMGEIRTQPTEE